MHAGRGRRHHACPEQGLGAVGHLAVLRPMRPGPCPTCVSHVRAWAIKGPWVLAWRYLHGRLQGMGDSRMGQEGSGAVEGGGEGLVVAWVAWA